MTYKVSVRGTLYPVRYDPDLLVEGNVVEVFYQHRDGPRALTFTIMEPYVQAFGRVITMSGASNVRRSIHPTEISTVRKPE